jgi:hypothetical protein
MMLLFEDIIEFHGPQSDGWILLSMDWINLYESDDAHHVVDVLSFLFHKYRTDIPDDVNTSTINYCLNSAIEFPNVECLRLILDSQPQETRDYIYGTPALFFIVRQLYIHKDISQFYFDRYSQSPLWRNSLLAINVVIDVMFEMVRAPQR